MMGRPYIVFQRLNEGLPKVIQSAEVSDVERSARPWAGSVLLPYRQQENGFPDRGELDRVGRIEDRLIAALEGQGTMHVGHVTCAGAMRVVFYGRGDAPKSVSVKTGLLKSESFEVEWRHDPEWSLYELELEASPEEAMEARFRPLWRTLAEHGDNHAAPRLVDFAALFPNADQRSAFLAETAGKGFVLSSMATWEDDQGGHWCELNKTMAIDPPTMLPECAYLTEAAKRHGGEFDGWACPVEK